MLSAPTLDLTTLFEVVFQNFKHPIPSIAVCSAKSLKTTWYMVFLTARDVRTTLGWFSLPVKTIYATEWIHIENTASVEINLSCGDDAFSFADRFICHSDR